MVPSRRSAIYVIPWDTTAETVKCKIHPKLAEPQNRKVPTARQFNVFLLDVSDDIFDSLNVFEVLLIVHFVPFGKPACCVLACVQSLEEARLTELVFVYYIQVLHQGGQSSTNED